MEDVIRGEWEPTSLGGWIDLLIIRNIRMWHLQERVYHLENLLKEDRAGLETYLKDATWMNLERNVAIDKLDATLVRRLFGEDALRPKSLEALSESARKVWEPVDEVGCD